MTIKTEIIGCGSYLPEKIVLNADLESIIDTSDEWIFSRTGIKKRHIAADNQHASHLAFEASKKAIEDANISPDLIDLVIVCTTTPDNSFPSTATKLQNYLGLVNKPAFDLQAVCSGFIYGLEVANSLIISGKYKIILLVCAEKMSSLLDWSDRSTCILFGDGAGAVILRGHNGDNQQNNSNIIATDIYADGSFFDILHTDGGISSNAKAGVIKMEGRILFKHAVEKMHSAILDLLKKENIELGEIDFFIPHQANARIIDNLANNLNIEQSKIVKTVDKHANCSAASIPLALSDLKERNLLKQGQLLLCSTIGAGLTWGVCLIRW